MKDQLIYFKRIVPMPSIPQSHSLNLISWESEIIMLTSQGLLWLYKIIQKIRMRLNMSSTHIISAAFIMKGASTFPTQQLHSPKKSSWKKFGVKSEKHHFVCEILIALKRMAATEISENICSFMVYSFTLSLLLLANESRKYTEILKIA